MAAVNESPVTYWSSQGSAPAHSKWHQRQAPFICGSISLTQQPIHRLGLGPQLGQLITHGRDGVCKLWRLYRQKR